MFSLFVFTLTMMMIILVLSKKKSRISSKVNVRMSSSSYESTWSNSKIIAPYVKQSNFPYICSNIRGLMSTKQINEKEVIIEIPIDKCLQSPEESDDKSCPDPDLLPIWQKIKGTSRLSLLLLKEYQLKDNSVIYDYIQNLPLPGTISTPFHWKENYIDNLPYPPLVRAVSIQKKQWRNFFEMLPNSYSKISYDRFVWSMEIVRSRAFNGIGGLGKSNANLFGGLSGALLGSAIIASQTVGETVPAILGSLAVLSLVPAVLEAKKSSCVLLPVIDSCNHNSIYPRAELALEPSKNSFVVRAKNSIKSNEQVSISYGDRTNDDLLQYFGFVEIDNPHDCYYILDPISTLKNALNNDNYNNVMTKSKRDIILKSIEELQETRKPSEAFDDMLVLTKKDPLSSWSLGSLKYIKDYLLDDDNSKSDDDDINMLVAMNNMTIKSCLRLMLQDEFERINSYISKNVADNGNDNISCIIKVFFTEKLKVIQNCLSKL